MFENNFNYSSNVIILRIIIMTTLITNNCKLIVNSFVDAHITETSLKLLAALKDLYTF